MNDVYVDKVKMAVELVDLLVAKGIVKDPEDKNAKIAQYLGDSEAALRDFLKCMRAAEVAKKTEAPNTGGWIGTYSYRQPVERGSMYPTPSILKASDPVHLLVVGPVTFKASMSHAETGSKLEVSGDAKALRWLFTEGPFSFLAEEPTDE